jgi:Flp pilus assembly protein TadG
VSRPRHAQRGQSLLEFAIVVPLFLLLLFGLIDFSRLLFTYVSLVNGARDLSRAAAISSRTTAASDGLTAFDNVTRIGGATSPATSVTLAPTGGGSPSCTGLTSAGCTFKLSPSGSSAVALSAGVNANGSGTFTGTPPTALGATGDGDFVVVTWLDGAGTGGFVQICPLGGTPLLDTACAPPGAVYGSLADGFVQVDVTYTFRFNPLFQNRLASVVDVSFMRQSSQLTTSARTYME